MLVFVYGTLKRGEPNHCWLTDDKNGCAKFLMFGKTASKYPLVIGSEYNIPFLLKPYDEFAIGHKNAILMRSNAYEEIAKLLKQSTLKAELQFIANSSSLFTLFTLKFQREELLVHQILMELELLVWMLAGRILKAKAAEKLLEDLSPRPFEDDKNMLPLLEIAASVSDEVQTCLRATDKLAKCVFLLSIQKHYTLAAKLWCKSQWSVAHRLRLCRRRSTYRRGKATFASEDSNLCLGRVSSWLLTCNQLCWNVIGEVYDVDEKMLSNLDVLEQHPTFYRREEISIATDDGNLLCWTYFLVDCRPELLKLPFLTEYSNEGSHGLRYVERE
ncbi:hypothetical protein QYM36_007804 [Artemia franciscana]|uniref:Gamma-glutamylcyclotransferase family protein n=1 Tax=Artemia franciscana TaxID=6661 RepID=A0AA88ID57_ARTSF|nr:hypothetical protein QYM36_007804 [Artemia franciscana]